MTDEPLDVEASRNAGAPAEEADPTRESAEEADPTRESAKRQNKGSPDQPWEPGEQRYSDRPEQGGETPGPARTEPPG
ncbi:hypothetical protein COUCH_03815 [Couchioplanes caeruleus]|uniref:hypothetical protein n=1 Tax=Couchioplanes caeruleus TaxID=56438 RepID=UPI0020C0D27E|nr:hypothetical protein [Couchioplanes caeruleus]UQU65470.1 hypothetical protein COUCH_03815 [Couchioplanes caeruleus]